MAGRIRSLLAGLAMAALLGACAAPGPAPEAEPGPGADGRNCVLVCTEWEEVCDIDPRGQKRCHRVCRRMGEQCF